MLRILAKPKVGKWNVFPDRLYDEIEKAGGVRVSEWTPAKMVLCAYDVLHLHWPDNVLNDRNAARAAFRVILLQAALLWTRLLGKKVVWTAHNMVSHDRFHPTVEKMFWRMFISSVSGIIYLSDESMGQMRSTRKAARRIPSIVTPIATYRGAYPNDIGADDARKALNLPPDAKVALNLGIMRSYKKVERLMEVARERPDITVIIAGMVDEDGYEDKLRARAEGLPNVRLRLEFIPEGELQLYLNAADMFVLTCDHITNSASAILALSFDLPIIAPELPCFSALRNRFGDEWVSIYEGGFDASEVAARFDAAAQRGKESRGRIDWSGFEWEEIAPKVREFFETQVGGR